MKSPPKQIADDEAYDATEQFIEQHAPHGAGGTAAAQPATA